MTDARTVIQLAHEGALSILTIHRPEKLNALNALVLHEMRLAIEELRGRHETRVLVVTGAGEKAFVAGADIAEMSAMRLEEARAFARSGHVTLDALEQLPVPVIAAVNGFALGGGCEMALACDFIFATEAARFGLPEVKLGAIPGFGGTQRLPRRIGAARAREWLYTGALVGAEEAARVGLVNRVFPGIDALMAGTRQVAAQIAAQPPLAVAQAKRAARRGLELTLPDACRLESALFAELFASDDLRRGMQAFIEAGQARRKGQDLKET